MEQKPVKRNEHIVPLSREHHFSLLFGWKIRQGLKKGIDPERILKYVTYFWEQHLSIHFREEEATLFATPNDDLIKKALSEHVDIEKAIKVLEDSEQHDFVEKNLEKLAKMIDTHVRFEEREVFPHLEKKLTEEQLKNMGRQLQELHAGEWKDDFKDEFWKK